MTFSAVTPNPTLSTQAFAPRSSTSSTPKTKKQKISSSESQTLPRPKRAHRAPTPPILNNTPAQKSIKKIYNFMLGFRSHIVAYLLMVHFLQVQNIKI